ncbi:MAG TPA: hypothetical protein DCW93_03255 [Saprospirales bacterium]|jgi:hypothetical protein|nr:hypothetical protein [Saprospirales bacterium]
MATLFDDILTRGLRAGQTPARSQEAREWFRRTAKRTAGANPDKILSNANDKDMRSSPAVGKMYHFFYDPKGKKTLPYYDRFPLIFMVGPASGGFYGINLHYLPPVLRARLMDNLYGIVSNKKYDRTTKLRLSYETLQGASKFRLFKPTFKHYLASNVRSRFYNVPPTEWDIALMLPTQRFEKASAQKVYSDSRRKI